MTMSKNTTSPHPTIKPTHSIRLPLPLPYHTQHPPLPQQHTCEHHQPTQFQFQFTMPHARADEWPAEERYIHFIDAPDNVQIAQQSGSTPHPADVAIVTADTGLITTGATSTLRTGQHRRDVHAELARYHNWVAADQRSLIGGGNREDSGNGNGGG
jgi:hypothetical protein